MTLRSRLAVEDGVIAVLYGLCMFLMMGLLALAIDLSALKFDRRATQVSADLSATAGALSLVAGTTGGSPLKACDTAWGYLAANLPEIPNTAPSPCAGDGWSDTSVCTSPPPPADATVGPFYVKIIWPVPDTSPYMQSRLDPDVDGDQCERIAVHISRTRSFIFGTLLTSATQSGTGGPAVAKAKLVEGDDNPAALAVLDPFSCRTLRAGGGRSSGRVHVWEAPGGNPGIIAVDSDGSGCSLMDTVIRLEGTNSEVKSGVNYEHPVTGAVTVGKGFIFRYANQPPAYLPADVTANQLLGGDPHPRHPVKSERVTRMPWEWRYDCKAIYPFSLISSRPHAPVAACNEYDPAAPTAKSHITNLRTFVANAASDPVANGFTVYTAAGYPCDVSGDPDGDGIPGLKLPSGKDWWIDCPKLRIQSELIVPDGDVVITGGGATAIELQGTLSINANSPDENYVYVVAGNFDKSGSASLRLGSTDPTEGGTFVLLNDGRLNFAGTGTPSDTGNVVWISPKFAGDPFEDLALWSTRAEKHELGGNVDNLAVEGTFYMPNAEFLFTGNGRMGQQKAQFVAYTLSARGQGALRMVPDPERSTPMYFPAVDLIR